MDILQTTNYQIFKKVEDNRKLKELNIQRLMESISTSNLLSINPIIVNTRFEVLDGQHRLEACKRLNIPVHYTVYRGDNYLDAIERLNTVQEKWRIEDYIHFHKDKEISQFLLSMEKKTNVSAATIFRIFFRQNSPKGGKRNLGSISDFFLKHSQQDLDKIPFVIEFFDYWLSIVSLLDIPYTEILYFRSGNFLRALKELYTNPDVDKEYLRDKLVRQHYLVPNIHGLNEMRRALVNLYNRNRQYKYRIKVKNVKDED